MNTVDALDAQMCEFGKTKFTEKDRLRFVQKVRKNESGCWKWTSDIMHDGYGTFNFQYNTRRAHRISYEMFVGPIPGGICVCHKCDIRDCVNPDHLFLGTCADNNRDAAIKGRKPKGSKNGNSRLIESQVMEIKELLKTDISQQKIADRFGVNQTVISCIFLGKTWNHI